MWVYILQSKKTLRFYIGYTANLTNRLLFHNAGFTKSTKSGIPWTLIYKEEYSNRKAAINREKQIKSYKSGEAFKRLIESKK